MVELRPETYHQRFIDDLLERGIVIDAKVRALLQDVKLLEVRTILVMANFKTAARFLEFPKGVNFQTPAWKKLLSQPECPQCGKNVEEKELRQGCPWCGFTFGGGFG